MSDFLEKMRSAITVKVVVSTISFISLVCKPML